MGLPGKKERDSWRNALMSAFFLMGQPPKGGWINYLQGNCVCVGVIGFANRGLC